VIEVLPFIRMGAIAEFFGAFLGSLLGIVIGLVALAFIIVMLLRKYLADFKWPSFGSSSSEEIVTSDSSQ
jgi:hypothetical protein